MRIQLLGFFLAIIIGISGCPAKWEGQYSLFPEMVTEHSSRDVAVSELWKVAHDIIEWKKQQSGGTHLLDGEVLNNAGDSDPDWYAFALGRLGTEDNQAQYLSKLQEYVERCYQTGDGLSKQKATEWHRISLAVIACGGDPTSFGKDADGKPINLIADGTYHRKKTAPLGKQGLNGYIWALITLDARKFAIPSDAGDTREDMIENILAGQLPDGGFALSKSTADVDITAMAIQALAPYYTSKTQYTFTLSCNNEQVTRTVFEAVDAALAWLGTQQSDSGEFVNQGRANAASICQVAAALSALGIHPESDERFIKGENTLWTALLRYQQTDGGFAQNIDADGRGVSNSMTCGQVLYTMAAWIRLKQGKTSLYDCTDMDSPGISGQMPTKKPDNPKAEPSAPPVPGSNHPEEEGAAGVPDDKKSGSAAMRKILFPAVILVLPAVILIIRKQHRK